MPGREHVERGIRKRQRRSLDQPAWQVALAAEFDGAFTHIDANGIPPTMECRFNHTPDAGADVEQPRLLCAHQWCNPVQAYAGRAQFLLAVMLVAAVIIRGIR